MDHRTAVQFPVQPVFNVINHIMHMQNIPFSRNLYMYRQHHSSRSIIMYHKIMDSKHALLLIGHHNLSYLIHKSRLRWLSKQGINRFFSCLEAGHSHKQGYNYTTITVNLNTRETGNQCCNQNNCCCNTVT